MFKKIYVEITNMCNLNCDFCIKNTREKQNITIDNFKILLNKLEGYTDYLYFHVLGEPLLHPNINELIDVASHTFNINITTNGYLIDKISDNKNIRQINISLHSFNNKYNKTLKEYLDNIFESIDKLKETTYISLRLWVKSPNNDEIIKYLKTKYDFEFNNIGNTALEKNVFLNMDQEFIWPDLNNNMNEQIGKCYGLIDHIGILVDGTVIPCCLDSKGDINLGNIYTDDLNTIISSKRCQNMINGFKNNKKVELLCQKCHFVSTKI